MRSLLVSILCVAPLATSGAQSTAGQRARVEALRSRLRLLEAAAARRDSAGRAERRIDTLTVGGFRILTDSAGSDRLQAAAESTWAIVSRELGVTPRTFEGPVIFVRLAGTDATWSDLVRPGDQFVHGDMSDDGLRRRLLAAAGAILGNRAGPRLERWTGGGLGLHHDRADLRRRALVEMITLTDDAGRACNAGQLSGCALALGIRLEEGLEDPDDRRGWRERVRTLDRPVAAGHLRESYDLCLQGVDNRCGSFLRYRGLLAVDHPPFSSETASGVLRTAGRLGGPGAFDRFLSTDPGAGLAGRLEAMAGAPLDSVLSEWWRDARATPRQRSEVSTGTQWSTLLWVMVFVALGLRVTRWR